MTEPEQWAVELARRAVVDFIKDKTDNPHTAPALTIQRAFEERERELRAEMAVVQQSHDWMYGEKQRLENALKDIASRAHANLAQALKEPPNDQ